MTKALLRVSLRLMIYVDDGGNGGKGIEGRCPDPASDTRAQLNCLKGTTKVIVSIHPAYVFVASNAIYTDSGTPMMTTQLTNVRLRADEVPLDVAGDYLRRC
jgi:hypothetical protein